MSLSRRFLLASVLPVVLAKAAYATTISTPPVIPDDNGTFFCLVTNVSAKTLDVQVDVFDMNGGTSGHFGFVTPPLATRAALGRWRYETPVRLMGSELCMSSSLVVAV